MNKNSVHISNLLSETARCEALGGIRRTKCIYKYTLEQHAGHKPQLVVEAEVEMYNEF